LIDSAGGDGDFDTGWPHSLGKSGKPGKVGEFKSGQGKARENRQSQGKCVLACGQLLRVLFITQNMSESCLLGKVLNIEHSCHSYERIYEYWCTAVRNEVNFFLYHHCC